MVTLDEQEIRFATAVGRDRHRRRVAEGRKPAHGMPEEKALQYHIDGAIAECAVAKGFNIYWTGISGQLRGPDCGPIEVRSTKYISGRLILHDDDSDHKPYVLVIARGSVFEIPDRCWVYGREGKKKEYIDDPTGQERDAYFVPRSVLHPIDELIALLKRCAA